MEKERKKISLATYVVSLIIMVAIIIFLAVMLVRNNASKEITKDTLENVSGEETVIEENEIELSNSELEELTNYLNDIENNGFLLSTYESIKDVDLMEVLYNGAGFAEEMDKERCMEVLGELPYLGVREFFTDDVNTFLKEKTGITYDLNQLIDRGFEYNKEFDAYYWSVGDTNYLKITCISGTKEGDYYKVNGKFYDYNTEKYDEDFTVVLEKTESGYRFIKNTLE